MTGPTSERIKSEVEDARRHVLDSLSELGPIETRAIIPEVLSRGNTHDRTTAALAVWELIASHQVVFGEDKQTVLLNPTDFTTS